MKVDGYEIKAYANLRDANLRYANLSDANLRVADLCDANLSDANLSGADLCDANLRGADLSGADLCDANLRGADLRGADLSWADLREADLRGADLSWADLRGADLSDANLRWADLCDADLRDANLSDANLSDADLRGAKNIPNEARLLTQIVPEVGAFDAFKRAGKHIVRLRIPAKAKRSNATSRKCRAEFAKVVWISDNAKLANSSRGGEYRLGEYIYPDRWDDYRWNECSHGIHFFLTKEEAERW